MELLTEELRRKLLDNGAQPDNDHPPAVKLFTPDGSGTWLLNELRPDEPDLAFGLCDLGFGEPELGYVRMSELAGVRGGLGLPIERDLYITLPDLPISVYATAARQAGRIVTDRASLGANEGRGAL